MIIYRRGSLYLANFNPSKGSEVGKIRSCLVMQSSLLNDAEHPSTTVIPLTTKLIDDVAPLRYRINARDKLEKDSDVMLDQTRTIDNQRMNSDILTSLTEREQLEIEEYWKIVLGLSGG